MGVGDEMPCDKALQASIVSAHVRMSLISEPTTSLHREYHSDSSATTHHGSQYFKRDVCALHYLL